MPAYTHAHTRTTEEDESNGVSLFVDLLHNASVLHTDSPWHATRQARERSVLCYDKRPTPSPLSAGLTRWQCWGRNHANGPVIPPHTVMMRGEERMVNKMKTSTFAVYTHSSLGHSPLHHRQGHHHILT